MVVNSNSRITTFPTLYVNKFKTYTWNIKAKDADGDTISFEISGDVPPGMWIDRWSGKLTYDYNSNNKSLTKRKFYIIASDNDGGEFKISCNL